MGSLQRGMGARMMLALMGGMAAMVAGVGGHFHADRQTAKRGKGSSRSGPSRSGRKAGAYGRMLAAHFNQKNVNYSAKPNKVAKSFGR